MGIGIRIEGLRKVYDTPPPMAARGAGFSWAGPRTGRKENKEKIEVQALDGISLVIRSGEVFGLLGPHGAGKTTTIAVLTTRVEPTSGRVFVGPHDVWKEQVKAKRLIGVVPQRPNLDFALTAREILLFHGAYFGQSARPRHDARPRSAVPRRAQRRPPRRALRRAQSRDLVPASHRKEFARLSWKTSYAMLSRDGHVARRNLFPMLLQNLLQPLLFVFIFGRVRTTSGIMRPEYKTLLLPGIMAISMVLSGTQAVAMPLITESQFTREIEDRLLAPMIMFGCAYYPWSVLKAFPALQIAVLVNPLVCASEGLRGALAPQSPHMSIAVVLGALLLIDVALLAAGLNRFHRKAVS